MALVGLDARVDQLVSLQLVQVVEGLVAELALVGPELGVDPQVTSDLVPRVERLPAMASTGVTFHHVARQYASEMAHNTFFSVKYGTASFRACKTQVILLQVTRVFPLYLQIVHKNACVLPSCCVCV